MTQPAPRPLERADPGRGPRAVPRRPGHPDRGLEPRVDAGEPAGRCRASWPSTSCCSPSATPSRARCSTCSRPARSPARCSTATCAPTCPPTGSTSTASWSRRPPTSPAWWREDLVSFLIGCSFTFETALAEAGVPVRHVEQGVNVPMYPTPGGAARPGRSPARWWSRCARSRPARWPTPCGSPPATRPCTARRCTSATRLRSASPTSEPRTSATRSRSARARCRCSGPAASPRRPP